MTKVYRYALLIVFLMCLFPPYRSHIVIAEYDDLEMFSGYRFLLTPPKYDRDEMREKLGLFVIGTTPSIDFSRLFLQIIALGALLAFFEIGHRVQKKQDDVFSEERSDK